jgi:hypothetical protein
MFATERSNSFIARLNQNYMLKKIAGFLTLLAITFTLHAQVTTSSISGTIKTSKGEALTGATVTATHVPTGTVYRVASRTGGRFNLANMNPGGPYSIVVSFVGLADAKKDDIYLALGENSTQEFALADKGAVLTEVVIAGRRGAPPAGKGGTETNITREKIAAQPSVGRSLSDFLRLTPQARLTAQEGAVSIAGQNNRYNSFYIDGAVNNDVYGISNSGTNGGQAGINPISIDAIDQLQIVISPYDASIGNFVGGGINAVTKSGTNQFQGSVTYVFRNQDMAGRAPLPVLKAGTINVYERPKLATFKNQTVNLSLGGPIIKNKLFFFVFAELERNIRPQPFNFGEYRGNTKSLDSVFILANYIKNTYKYDVGAFLDNPEEINADRIATKIDWNINDHNKFTASYRYTKGMRYNTSGSSGTTINFYNNGYIFPTTTQSYSAELKTSFDRGASNRLLLTYTSVNDDRGPLGDPFPRVRINDGSGAFVFGTENSSTQNLLTQKNFSVFDSYKMITGKHIISVGTDNEFNKSFNVFIQNTFGNYTYTTPADFYNQARPSLYQRNFSLIDNINTDNTAAAAQFNTLRIGFFVNDEIKINDHFTLNLGVRADKAEFLTKPLADKYFNDTALAIISQFYDMKGARSGLTPNIPFSISPRIGFTYKMDEDNIVVRGGLGLFTGRIPLVWPGGIYNNNGISVGGFSVNTPNIPFRADPYNQFTAADLGASIGSKGSMQLISKDFRLPKVFRTSLGVDRKFGNGWTTTFEAMFTKNINEIYYTNFIVQPPTLKPVGPDQRNVYSATTGGPKINLRPTSPTLYNPYDASFLLTNAEGQKGYSYNFTFTVDKATRNGLVFNANYSYGNSMVINDGTSSTNLSQWRFMETVNGRNFIGLSTSDFDAGHRITASIGKKFTYLNKSMATTISLFYTGQSGAPFSWTYSTGSLTRDYATGETNDLLYIPTATELQGMTFLSNTVNGVVFNAQTQKDMLESYIQGNKYLSKHRGQYAERNGDRLPFTNILDLKLQQDFTVKFGGRQYQLQLIYDVSNFTNMINKDWGRTYFMTNDNYGLVSFAGFISATNLTPQYRFSPQTGKPWTVNNSVVPNYSARWLSQVTVRLKF